MMLGYQPSPTGQAFLDSKAFLKIVMGPVGGGKSTVALMDLAWRAVQQEPFNNVRRTKFIILRNTIAQLKSTVKPLLDTWFVTLTGGTMGRWRLSDNIFEAMFKLPDGTIVHSEFVLMAADTPEDVRRLLSLECSAAWVEEAREVDSEVFAGLQGRVNRFPARIAGGVTYPGVICSTNPPPLGGFWHDFITQEEKGKDVFIQPAALLDNGAINPQAENLGNLAPDYYDNLLSGKTEDWINVYLKNQFGAGDMGRPIYKGSFKTSFHMATSRLLPVSQSVNPLVIGMDNGLQAAAVIGQRDMRGRVNLMAECYVPEDETMGVETFLKRLLVPLLRDKFPGFRAENIRFMLDPACFARSQVDEKTIAQAVKAYGYQVLAAPTNDPERRVQAVEALLTAQVDGAAAFLIDPGCTHTIDTLAWGHRYKKSKAGLTSTTAEKNHYSHCFVAGTQVSTPQGPVPIERITCDHEVMTPSGRQPVIATMSHTAPELVELTFDNGSVLVCTPDHPFFTLRGLVQANTLEYTDVLFTSGEKTCEKPYTPFKSSADFGFTASPTGTTKRSTKTAGTTCTGSCGSTTTAHCPDDATTCTTSTGTKQTTGSRIWNYLQQLTIWRTTCTSATAPPKDWLKPWRRWLLHAPQPLPGTPAKPACSGTARTANVFGRAEPKSISSAHTAPNSTRATQRSPSAVFAPPPARVAPAKPPALTTFSESAPCAAPASQSTNTSKRGPAARLVGRRPFPAPAKVYDLTVEVEHCFYAGGVLVSNCGDAVQYLALNYAVPQDDNAGRGRRRDVKASTYRYV